MAKGKILVIDDDPMMIHHVVATLTAAGFTVQAALDGREGQRAFTESPADLVLTDIIMPEREGIETIIALRKQDPGVRIIAMSGGYRVGPADFLEMALHVGADAILAKPFRRSDLLSKIEEVLAADPRPRVA